MPNSGATIKLTYLIIILFFIQLIFYNITILNVIIIVVIYHFNAIVACNHEPKINLLSFGFCCGETSSGLRESEHR